jgi:hypothetical protein
VNDISAPGCAMKRSKESLTQTQEMNLCKMVGAFSLPTDRQANAPIYSVIGDPTLRNCISIKGVCFSSECGDFSEFRSRELLKRGKG